MICQCGCNVEIEPKPFHKYRNIRYLVGHARKGKPMSIEHKQKIGFRNSVSLLGKSTPVEVRNKIGKSNIGKHKMSESLKEKLRNAKLGKRRELVTRQKISNGLSGNESFGGFLTPLNKALRRTEKYVAWRESIFRRDDYLCKNCGKTGYLEVHHKIPLYQLLFNEKINDLETALNKPEIWNLDNGITLCLQCHVQVDKYRNKFKGDSKFSDISSNIQ